MFRWIAATIVLVGSATSPAASFAAGLHLPLPDGTYAQQAAYCQMKRADAIADFEGAYIDIAGAQVDYYEASCTVSRVRVSNGELRFRESCTGEGETDVRDATWRLLPDNRFRFGELTYVYCGRRLAD